MTTVAAAGALDQSRTVLWWSALGAVVVVIVCVVILLTLLSSFVRDIEHRLRLARADAAQASAHLAASPLIGEAADLIKELAGHLERQTGVVTAEPGDAA